MEIAVEELPAVEAADVYELPPEEERTPWYEPGLLRRIGRRRTVERPKRRSLRERMHDRGLHWSAELVAGVFVAVLVTSLATIAVLDLRAGGASSLSIPGNGASSGDVDSGTAGGAGAGAGTGSGSAGAFGGTAVQQPQVQAVPTSTPLCIAAPIPGSAMRPCTH